MGVIRVPKGVCGACQVGFFVEVIVFDPLIFVEEELHMLLP